MVCMVAVMGASRYPDVVMLSIELLLFVSLISSMVSLRQTDTHGGQSIASTSPRTIQ